MRRIVVDAEKHIDFNLSFFEKSPKNHIDMNIAISYGAVGLSMHSNAKGILLFPQLDDRPLPSAHLGLQILFLR